MSAPGPSAAARGMRWWGRLLLVLAAEALLVGAYVLEARPATFTSGHPPWLVYVFIAFLLVVVVQGTARLRSLGWGIVWLLGATAALAGVWGAVPAYIAHVGHQQTVTVLSAEREVVRGSSAARSASTLTSYSVAQVRVEGEPRVRTAYLRGNWSESAGRRTTVRADPLGVAGLQSASPTRGLSLFWLVLWVPAFVALQAGLVAVVLRRGPSLVMKE